MKDNYISRAAVTAAGLWLLAAMFVTTTWLLAILDAPPRWVSATAVTAVLCMAGAVVCQMRVYTLRVCGLIRVSAGLETPNADVRNLVSRN
jgi:uncharacterized membrane protein YqjE